MTQDILGPSIVHRRHLTFVFSVWQHEQTRIVKSSSTGYGLMRVGTILNGGYGVQALNKPHIVPRG